MATSTVPGKAKENRDVLDVGCWAEADKGKSLILVIGMEGGKVFYQMFDLTKQQPSHYLSNMVEKDFKDIFSFPPHGKSKVNWTWHDKTKFPWENVQRYMDFPVPQIVDAVDRLQSAVDIVVDELGLRGKTLQKKDLEGKVSAEGKKSGQHIMDRLKKALDVFLEG